MAKSSTSTSTRRSVEESGLKLAQRIGSRSTRRSGSGRGDAIAAMAMAVRL